jgi:transposase
VHATNRPSEQLSIEQAVLTYHDEYLVERSLGRLKGAPLSLCPMFLSRQDHVCGLIWLLTLGVRVLSVLEYAIRHQLTQEQTALAELYPDQEQRSTAQPTTERVLEAFGNLTLTVVELPGQVLHHLTPLSALHQRLLALAGLSPDI